MSSIDISDVIPIGDETVDENFEGFLEEYEDEEEDEQIIYVESNGQTCPYCLETGEIQTAGTVEISDGYAFQEVFCGACDRQWTDVYQLVGFNPTDV